MSPKAPPSLVALSSTVAGSATPSSVSGIRFPHYVTTSP